MRKVNRKRTFVPTGLAAAEGRELARYRKHQAKPAPRNAFIFRAYKDDEVRHALEALFHGKCAYCESRYDVTAPVDIEHYRPKSAAQDGSHGGYWWLAASWTNLLPSCIDCNRKRKQPTPIVRASLSMLVADRLGGRSVGIVQTGKESCFPIQGARVVGPPSSGAADAAKLAESELLRERPLLLDPCRDKPNDHLEFYIDRARPLGLVFSRGVGRVGPGLPAACSDPAAVEQAARAAGISERGAVSIQVYGLNRLRLLQERTRVLRQLEFLARLVTDLDGTAARISSLAVSGADRAVRDEAVDRIESATLRLVKRMMAMASPDAPFSGMVAQWLTAYTR